MLKKQDRILIIVVLMIAAVLFGLTRFATRQQGEQVEVLVDGIVYGSYLLDENQIIEIDNERGYNRLVIAEGQVCMEEADCPDQYCVEHQAITNQNETIVCLPHRLVVQVTAKEKDKQQEALQIDGIAQ